LDYGALANSDLLTDFGFCVPDNQFDYVRVKYQHPTLSLNVKDYLKEEISVNLKRSGFNFELLTYLRLCFKEVQDEYEKELRVIEEMNAILSGLRDKIQALLSKEVFADTSKHPLLIFAKIYQEEQLKIVNAQISLIEQVHEHKFAEVEAYSATMKEYASQIKEFQRTSKK